MTAPVLRIFSYLPNPRVWKALIAGDLCGVEVEVVGDEPPNLGNWLWDYDARPLPDAERTADSPHARTGRRGFSGTLFKTEAFLEAHPFGTVPAAFAPGGDVGVFESNSILRAVARAGAHNRQLYGRDGYEASRIDSFLDANLVFAREAQVYLLELREPTAATHARMAAAYEFYLAGIESALGRAEYLAGDGLSIADIAFVCDLAQFLGERRGHRRLASVGLKPVSRDGRDEYPRAYGHMLELCETDAFSTYFEGYLDRADSTA
ncbi:MAG: glutathione S-transferase family protein [Gammaproteobacteria bacterium]|nr:glutathione S-transferase family protein [Gammaproteobacteria bacterium]MYE83304.1 glutathione S-transferase family protein [Gammaproteobacteria bacterium]